MSLINTMVSMRSRLGQACTPAETNIELMLYLVNELSALITNIVRDQDQDKIPRVKLYNKYYFYLEKWKVLHLNKWLYIYEKNQTLEVESVH